MSAALYPLLFQPVYKDYVWGGRRIPREFDRDVPPLDRYAESWEIADRPEGMSIVMNGPASGTPLRDLVASMGPDLVGTSCTTDAFPLLIKIIDAEQTLSVQVHPDDRAAAEHGGEPKTEMWYVLDATEDAAIYIGLRPGTSPESFRRAVEEARVQDYLNRIKPSRGDVVFVPGGRVHAIGGGCLLLEIQQNSNTTYRVYDWGRMGADGNPRELHVEQALEVIRWQDDRPVRPPAYPAAPLDGESPSRELLRSRWFRLSEIELNGAADLHNDGRSFHALFVTHGSVRCEAGGRAVELPLGTSCLLPAAVKRYTLTPRTPRSHLLVTGIAPAALNPERPDQ